MAGMNGCIGITAVSIISVSHLVSYEETLLVAPKIGDHDAQFL